MRISAVLLALAIFFQPLPSESPEPGICAESVALPVLMYHRISKNSGMQGRFCISPQEFERDLVYLKEHGYETVHFSQVVGFIRGECGLPEKPVVLSFDDGGFSDYHYAFPLLKKYSMKAVFSIIGCVTDKYSDQERGDVNFPNLTWKQIREMTGSGLAEIQSHSYNLHGGVGAMKRKNEPRQAYERRLGSDLERLQKRAFEMIGKAPDIFTYPLGVVSAGSQDVLRELGFSGSLSCREGVNVVKPGDPECLFLMKRLIRPHGKDAGTILSGR